MKRSIMSLCFVLWLISCSVTVHAAIIGSVTDTQGKPVMHALLTFISEADSNSMSRTTTDSLGHYELINLPTNIKEDQQLSFSLGQNFPNPFNPSTTIPFTLDVPGLVTLTIYNIIGQKTRTLVDCELAAGEHNLIWDGRDDKGAGVSSGVYLCQLSKQGNVQTRKMLLLDGGGLNRNYTRSVQDVSAKRSSGGNSNLVTVNVERFPFRTNRQEHVDLSLTTKLDFIMLESEELVFIPGATFQMGDVENEGYDNEKPVHSVTLSGFEMSAYEITNAQFAAFLNVSIQNSTIEVSDGDVLGKTGEWSGLMYLDIETSAIGFDGKSFTVYAGYEYLPVVPVTWYGSKAFAHTCGCDLPTEAEWEYACRGGKQYNYGTDDGTISSTKANYSGVGNPVTVGSYPANPFGIYDMSGNVYEWCHDWYGIYVDGGLINPTGAQSGEFRVIRGGSYKTVYDMYCRSANRNCNDPLGYNGYGDVGFRVVRRSGGVMY